MNLSDKIKALSPDDSKFLCQLLNVWGDLPVEADTSTVPFVTARSLGDMSEAIRPRLKFERAQQLDRIMHNLGVS
jgi:hypothetical protein